MITVAPCDVIAVFQPGQARVVAVLEFGDLRVIADPFDRLVVDVPIHSILAAAKIQVHHPAGVVDAEDAHVFAAIGDHRAVENAV